MDTPDFEAAKNYSLDRLTRELPAFLTYHCLTHTSEEVVPAARRIALIEGVGEEDLLLVTTAAWYHDLGFVQKVVGHELISIEFACQVLPDFHYSRQQIDRIAGMILATRLPQSPQNRLEEIVVDADMDVLGRVDFMKRNNDLRLEMAAMGIQNTDEYWFRMQVAFLQAHHYFTNAAHFLRNEVKQKNIEMMARLHQAAV
jgi:uncharacterized protein